jgi:hypothetical protein
VSEDKGESEDDGMDFEPYEYQRNEDTEPEARPTFITKKQSFKIQEMIEDLHVALDKPFIPLTTRNVSSSLFLRLTTTQDTFSSFQNR